MSETKLLPCPWCSCPAVAPSTARMGVQCLMGSCACIGPLDDPNGAKWNALPRTPAPAVGMSDGEMIARAIAAIGRLRIEPLDSGGFDLFMPKDADLDAELSRRAASRQGASPKKGGNILDSPNGESNDLE